MRLQNTPEIARLDGYMEAMGTCLKGRDYVVWFNTKGIELEGKDLDSKVLDDLEIKADLQKVTPGQELQSLMQLAYPGAKPHLATMCEYSPRNLTAKVNTFIAHINPSDGLQNVRKYKKQDLITGFWGNVSACIDYKNSRVFQYYPAFGVEDGLWDFTIWGFTFLVVEKEKNRCLLIHGAAVD